MKLRQYQLDAVDSIIREFGDNRSTLAVMATGTGKTQTFCEVVRRSLPKRAMVIAHREELISQAVKRFGSFGIDAEIEMADLRTNTSMFSRPPVVVSTVQTQCSGERMKKFAPDDFGLLIIDEAHHGTAASYKRLIDWYCQNKELRVLGVTATPDRADEEALGQVFETVAVDYEIIDAIKDGWLVPISQQMVTIEGLDFSHIRTTAGDLNGADLASVMEAEKNLQGVAASSIEIIGDRKTVVFTASVKHAEMMSEIFNRWRPHSSEWICGATPKWERQETLKRFANREIQILCNCAILTEGYDDPGIQCVIQARPTKSRALYSQICGRGTRPYGVDLENVDSADDRRALIAGSQKPSVLIVDFVGNSGRHKLVTAADVLGGHVSDEVVAAATERAKKGGRPVDVIELLEEEEAERERQEEIRRKLAEEHRLKEAARRAHLVAKAQYSVRTIDPFALWHLEPERDRGWDRGKTLSQKQRDLLLKQGINPDGIGYHNARRLINTMFARWQGKMATLKQCNLLKRFGYDGAAMSMDQATTLITRIKNAGWRRPE